MMKEPKREKTTIKKIQMNDFHSKIYLKKLRETTYKNEKVVFILPNGKEWKYE